MPDKEPDAHRQTEPSEQTVREDRKDSHATHEPDRMPTADEEALADKAEPDSSVAEHVREMTKKGAEVKGEGQI